MGLLRFHKRWKKGLSYVTQSFVIDGQNFCNPDSFVGWVSISVTHWNLS